MDQQCSCLLPVEGLVQLLRNYHFIHSCEIRYLKWLPFIYSTTSEVLLSLLFFDALDFFQLFYLPLSDIFSLHSLFHHLPSTSTSCTWDTNIMLQCDLINIGNQAELVPSSHLQTWAPCHDTASIKETLMTFSMSLAPSLNSCCITALLLILERCKLQGQ